MYNNLKVQVKTDGKFSPIFQSTIGTKQGCPMSSTLFNLYINDIPNIISCANNDPVKLDNQKINCLLYADDHVLLSETSQGLQQSLNTLYSYCKKWKLKVNIKKTKLMVFNSRNYRINAYLGQDLIEQVDKYTYLGCIMTPSGSFKVYAQRFFNSYFCIVK